MRLIVVLLTLPAVLSLQLRHRNFAADLASAEEAGSESKKPTADCVTVAKEGIKQVFESVEEIQTVLDGLDDGSSCKLDQASIDKAVQKHEDAKQAAKDAKKAVQDAEGAEAPCCEISLSALEAASEEGQFPAGYKACTALKDQMDKLDDLKGKAAAQPAIVQAAADNINDVTEAAEKALNKCICSAEDNIEKVFKTNQEEEALKRPGREKTILLERQVICTNENAADGGKVDACDDLQLSAEDKAKLDLKKPSLAAGLTCARSAPATSAPAEPCSTWENDKTMYTCDTVPKCCEGFSAAYATVATETEVQCVVSEWLGKGNYVSCGATKPATQAPEQPPVTAAPEEVSAGPAVVTGAPAPAPYQAPAPPAAKCPKLTCDKTSDKLGDTCSLVNSLWAGSIAACGGDNPVKSPMWGSCCKTCSSHCGQTATPTPTPASPPPPPPTVSLYVIKKTDTETDRADGDNIDDDTTECYDYAECPQNKVEVAKTQMAKDANAERSEVKEGLCKEQTDYKARMGPRFSSINGIGRVQYERYRK